MSKKDKLTPEQEKELAHLAAEIEAEAIQMRIDYETTPSEESGSVVFINQESPLLKNEDEKLGTTALVSSTQILAKEVKKQKENKEEEE
jgi:hypothetical protein|tara:strand:+ start:1589 stop:1855 length:267 start_codon:yes stop_codon:yes gene_type:complete